MCPTCNAGWRPVVDSCEMGGEMGRTFFSHLLDKVPGFFRLPKIDRNDWRQNIGE